LGLGGNLGPVEATLRWALVRLAAALGPLEVASLFRSRAVAPTEQPDYLNTAAVGRSSLTAEELLALAKSLERAAGRTRGPRFASRPLDIDLLLYDAVVATAPELTLPHPRLAVRRFVLAPLAEIAPRWPVPPGGERVADLAAGAGLTGAVERIGWSREPG
jgi:2-amino-4-hydroxy-6-hydroxymethyldihydropteridine diphosphokinase